MEVLFVLVVHNEEFVVCNACDVASASINKRGRKKQFISEKVASDSLQVTVKKTVLLWNAGMQEFNFHGD